MATSMAPTFLAALRAVGTAMVMAGAGFYLHRRNCVTPSGKKMLALISQQVTIPAFLFAKIIYCPSAGVSQSSDDGGVTEMDLDDALPEIVCPSVANRISDLWMLLLWPVYVVLCGLFTGYLAAKISKTPPLQTRSCLAACAFGNSTGLVITLLSVIHTQFNKSTELGRIDPTAFLSVYLLLYPVLQWGVGGWLLAPEEKMENGGNNGLSMFDKIEGGNVNGLSKDKEAGNNGNSEASHLLTHQDALNHVQSSQNQTSSHRRHISHILNYEPALQSPSMAAGQEEFGGLRSRRVMLTNKEGNRHYIDSSSNALAMMVSELSFSSIVHHGSHGSFEEMPSHLQSPQAMRQMRSPNRNISANGDSTCLQTQPESEMESDGGPLSMDVDGDATAALGANPPTIHEHIPFSNGNTILPMTPSHDQIQSIQEADLLPLTETLFRISRKVFQPPVIGALLGLFIASFPTLRGMFENIWGDDGKTAPLKFMFDGIYSVGAAAVPINMIILGINLSSTFQKKKTKNNTDIGDDDEKSKKMLPNQTMLAVVFGKMIVMPIIGMVSTWFLQRYYIHFPDEIDATCYLVMMIVFITPTANNVMVMVELSGSSSKEGMARLIGWQYAVSPVVLSVVLSAVVSLASCHFNISPDCST